MFVSYDTFFEAFLQKVTEYDFLRMGEDEREGLVTGYLKRAVAQFSEVCVRDLSKQDDVNREFELDDDIDVIEMDEIIDIITDIMLYQWMRQYQYKQENLEIMLNTTDFTSYSPAELLYRITNAYKMTKRNVEVAIREYSFKHNDLTVLYT